jgi:hypothetical protein
MHGSSAAPTSAKVVVDVSLFHDVRGIHSHQIDEEFAYRLGTAVSRLLSNLKDIPRGSCRSQRGRT